MIMTDYRARALPVALVEVPEGDTGATLRLLSGEGRTMSVTPGQEIPETGLTVDKVKRRIISSKRGFGRPVDASEVLLTESSTGQRILVVKGLPAVSGEACGFVKMRGKEDLLECRRGDEFHAGPLPVKVAEIRLTGIVLERTDTRETATITRAGAE
jgi:hypothetical protein